MIRGMAEGESYKQQHAWRSKFRSRSHDEAHDGAQAASPVDCEHGQVFRGKAELVDTQEGLAGLIGRLRATGSFAYDSEFIGELSYVPKLCLIQIATSAEIALVDPLAAMDLRPLWELLADEAVEKIVHAGPQDMEPVNRMLGRPAANVVDTQIAAGFACLPYPISLQRLVLQLLGVRLGKGLTFTHWDQRPLSTQQLRYAADDVRYLPAGWMELKKRVDAAGTMAWVKEESKAMCLSSPYQFDPETTHQRVRGSGSLDPKQVGILRELCVWRNMAAMKEDLPPRTLLRDDVLIDLCRRAPITDEKLQNIQGLPRPMRLAHGEAIIAAIVRGKQATPAESEGEIRKTDELPAEQFKVDGLLALAQTLAMGHGVDPQIVMTRSDVAALVRQASRHGQADGLRLMQSWRGELVGKKLVKLVREGGAVGVTVALGQVRCGE